MRNSTALEAFESNANFQHYAKQMMAAGRNFPSTKKNNQTGKTGNLITADDPMTRNQWMDCCFREYIQRKKKFGSDHGNTKFIYLCFFIISTVVAIILAYVWPIWSFLIEFDVKSYYGILGLEYGADPSAVVKAYRKQIKLWHPDSNPNCGAHCRTKTEKIQQAYEVLLERKGHRSFLDNQYLNRLLQLRSLFFFRMYSLSLNAAHEMSNLLFHLCDIKIGDDWRLPLTFICHLITFFLFISHEIFVISGFDIILLFQIFIFIINGFRSSAREMAKANKNSVYTDIFREALWMIISPVSVNLLYIAFYMDSLDLTKEVLRVVLGFIYVVAYLGRFTPNLYSNLKEKTCKVSLCYQNQERQPVSEFLLFIQAELTFLVDDLFIFTCRVPSIYRMVVFASHTFYLMQYFLFPRKFPHLESIGHQKDDEFTEKYVGNQKAMPQNQTVAHRELSETDIELLSKLDQDPTCWLDIPRSKYNSVISMLISKLVDRGVNAISIDFTCTSDMKSIAFFLHDTKNHVVNGIFLIPDSSMARLIGLERNPLLSAPCTDKERLDKKYLKESCLRSLGSEANLTASEVWRRRTNIPTDSPVPRNTFQRVFWAILYFLLFLVFRFCIQMNPTSVDLLDSLVFVPASMQPLRVSRFSNLLDSEHILNRANNGLFTFLDSFVFCTMDFWDSYRHLLFYTNS
ncbi:unnamed protein product [Phytomonas sp. Hart1]|nr:unnamed protein product [Phytomonas sp. Hart1]|eukprot:CCW67653.1 unnamed protein product [Phytomonas sp. isolate Hart1]